MWNLEWDRDERFTVSHGTNPKCYICERFFTDESETSSLANCGGYFDKVFTQEDLTEYGLIPDIESAIRIRDELETNFPDEEHAYCEIFAIWRRRE